MRNRNLFRYLSLAALFALGVLRLNAQSGGVYCVYSWQEVTRWDCESHLSRMSSIVNSELAVANATNASLDAGPHPAIGNKIVYGGGYP